MSELSDNAQVALSALREDVASTKQKERVRARLAALGLAVGAGSAVTAVSAGAAAAVAGSAATGGSASSLGGVASLSVAPASTVGTTGAATAAVGAASKLTAAAVVSGKLASLPLAMKTAALVVVLGSSAALPLAMREPAASPAKSAVVQTEKTSAPLVQKSERESVPMKLDVVAAPAPEPEQPAELPSSIEDSKVETEAQTAPSLRAHRKLLPASSRAVEVQDVASTLAAESALLADALRALRTGNLARAHALLEQHREKFGEQALLAPERERMKRELAVEVSSSQ